MRAAQALISAYAEQAAAITTRLGASEAHVDPSTTMSLRPGTTLPSKIQVAASHSMDDDWGRADMVMVSCPASDEASWAGVADMCHQRLPATALVVTFDKPLPPIAAAQASTGDAKGPSLQDQQGDTHFALSWQCQVQGSWPGGVGVARVYERAACQS